MSSFAILRKRLVDSAAVRLGLGLVVGYASYLLAAEMGLVFGFLEGDVSPIWPPSGLALALLLRFRLALWPAVFAGSFTVAYGIGSPLLGALAIGTGSTLEAVVAVLVLRRLIGVAQGSELTSVRSVGWLLSVAAATPILAALTGGASLCVLGEAPWSAFWPIAGVWWLGDAAGAALIGPFLLYWLSPAPYRAGLSEWAERAATLAVVAASTVLVLLINTASPYVALFALGLLPFPFLIIAAVRAGLAGATIGVVMAAAIALTGAGAGLGPFALLDPYESLAAVEAFMGVSVISTLVVAAALAERRELEAEARTSEQRFADMAETAADWQWETDADQRFSYISPGFARATGFAPETFIGKRRNDIADPTRTAGWTAHMEQLRAREPFRNFTYSFHDSAGRLLTAEVSGKPIFDRDGRFAGYRGTGRNLTPVIEARTEAQRQRQRLYDALEATTLGFCIYDANDRLEFYNSAYARMVAPHEEVLQPGTTFESVVRALYAASPPGEGRGREEAWVRERVARHRAGNQSTDLHWNGRYLAVEERRMPDGGTALVLNDMTERFRADDARRTAEERLTAFLDGAPDAISLKDTEGRYVMCNEAFARMVDVAKDAIIGLTNDDVFPDDAPIRGRISTHEQAVVESKSVISEERTVIDRDGQTRFLKITKFPVFGFGGKVSGIGTINQDITEQRRTEDQLRQAQRMEAVGQLTGGVAHDFNNLLAVILGNLELAREQGVDGTVGEMLDTAIKAADRGAQLTQQLLAFGRRQTLHPEATDLNALIQGLESMLRRTFDETIQIVTRLAPDLGTTRVDRAQLETALLNLALNARDAMPSRGRLTIETANTHLDVDYVDAQPETVAPGPYTVIAVSDNGSGMDPEVARRAFEPFFTTKEVGRGTGLGLAMVYGFVKQSGGHARIYSEPGQGTTVRLYLPSGIEEAPRPDTADRAGPPARFIERVLVVEDDADVRRLVVSQLARLGFDVLETAEGDAALAVLERDPPIDILLTDVVLPGALRGPQLAAEARSRWPGLAVAFMSGYSEGALAHPDGLPDDAVLLSKPFRLVALAEALRTALDRTRP